MKIHNYSLAGDLNGVIQELDNKISVNSIDQNGFTPLHYAAKNGDLKMVELLLSYGANINAESNNFVTPLHLAAIHRNENVLNFLIKKGVDTSFLPFVIILYKIYTSLKNVSKKFTNASHLLKYK
jgi:ankyrin repeat protein